MPELPEVKMYAKNLNSLCAYNEILDARCYTDGDLSSLVGRTAERVRSYGKGIYFDFEGGGNMFVHLMITGGFAFCKEEDFAEVKDKLWAIKFSGGYLCLCDKNRYARTEFNRTASSVPEAGGEGFTRKYFSSLFNGRRAVKNVLTDQSVIAGIGNAYADEILYGARINPFRAAKKLSEDEIGALYEAVKSELAYAEEFLLENRPDMLSGEDRSFFKVHVRGKSFTERGEPILSATRNGRKTFYTLSQI